MDFLLFRCEFCFLGDPWYHVNHILVSRPRLFFARWRHLDNLRAVCLRDVGRSFESLGGRCFAGLLGVYYGLALRVQLEALVLAVLLIEIVIGLGRQLRGDLLQHALEDAVDLLLPGPPSAADGDEEGIEAHGEADAADLVACVWTKRSAYEIPRSAALALGLSRRLTFVQHAL